MTTKNLSKTFKGKISGQRLPPIPVANEPSIVSTTNGNHPNSILKKSKSVVEDEPIDNHRLSIDDDDFDTPRTIFQKSQADVLLLLDTYPPRTWVVPKCLKVNNDNTLDQDQTANRILDTFLSANNQSDDLIDAFPAPLSDRLPSSRYCRRSISSSCSRRSSILFQRQTGIPVDSSQLRREETFDTCESLTETLRTSYTPLPPIATNSTSNVTKSLNIPNNDPLSIPISTDPPLDFSKSLSVQSTDLISSVSPPLITPEENPDIEERKEQFTRHLLLKSFHRERSTVLPTEKVMHSPTVTNKTVTFKSVNVPRTQKPVVENHRVHSVDRQSVTTVNRNKLTPAASIVSINTATYQRLGKLPLDIFQPQSKSTVNNQSTTKKSIVINTNNKTKNSTKNNAPKLKVTSVLPDEETNQSNDDVIPPSLPSPSSTSNQTSQVTNTDKSEPLPLPVINIEPVSSQLIQTKLDVPIESKHPPPSRSSNSRYSQRPSHPVPQPLTLQGEKTVDADYPQITARKTMASAIGCGQRRGSLKGQPLIMELFQDSAMETQKSIVKLESSPPIKSIPMKLKKPRSNFVKHTKVKKPIAPNKPKPPAVVTSKIEVKCQSTNTETHETPKTDENIIVVGGTNWMINVKPQVTDDNEAALSQACNQSVIDNEDLLSCHSLEIDPLAASQSTLMTSINEVQRRDSIGSEQAIEISPVLTQMIDHNIEPIPESPQQLPQPNESSLFNSDIRTVYETVKDSIRKDSSLRSTAFTSHEHDVTPIKPLLSSSSTTSSSTQNKTLPFETNGSITQTYNNSDTSLSLRPALRVVNDSLNSRGSETIDSTSSHEDYGTMPLCNDNDCDEIYRTARKGRQVGRGAYGIVWSCLTVTGRVIAVKEIELDEGDSERLRDDYESVREEINILRALNHQYVVKFLGISLENTRLVKIFMEFLPNGTIEHLLLSFGPFHNDVLKKYTRQLVEGVAYLHDNNVVHRDIKGKNIMLDVDGNIKLIDFGCAKRLKKNQNTHSMRHLLKSMKGTANWMAPEVIAETGHGKKADIWSIGCTLCEMATGKPPWSSEHNHLAVLLIIVNGTKPPADLPDTCPVTAQEFFRLCLTRDPLQRPSARELLSHPFLAT